MEENSNILEEDLDILKISNKSNDNQNLDNKELNLSNIDKESNEDGNDFNGNISSSSEDEENEHSEPFNSFDGINHIKINRKIFIYNIKDHIMMISLLISSSMNFSILYIPLVIIGLFYIILLLNNNKDNKTTKLKIEIICLIYSILLFIFKLVFIGFIDNGKLDSEKSIKYLNNFGIRYTKEKQEVFEIIITFIGEGILLIACIYSIFISILYKKIDMEINVSDITKGRLFSRIKFIIYFCYILLLCYAIFNRSFLTLIYLFIYNTFLIIITFRNNFPVVFMVFKIIRIFFLSILSLQLFFINFFNIYYFQQNLCNLTFIYYDEDKTKIKKIYSKLTILGINYTYYHTIIQFLYEWLSYIICVCIIVLLSGCKKFVNDYKNILNPIQNKGTYELKNVYVNFDDKSNIKNEPIKNIEDNKKGILMKINIYLLHFFTHPDFIIHLLRVISIIWIYELRNFFSIGIYIFLFCSFIFNDISKNKILTIFLLLPITIISFGCLHISNINGYLENLNENERDNYIHYGLEKDEGNLKYIFVGIYYLFVILFLNSFIDYNSSTKLKMNLPSRNSLLAENDNWELNIIEDNKVPLLIKGEKNEENKNNKEIDNNNININNKSNNNINNNINTNNKNNKKDKNLEDILLSDVILKFIYLNIDKITLVVMYLISMHTVNIIHFIFIIIFIFEILQPKMVERFNKIIIIIIQILFLFEYIVDLTRNYFKEYFIDNINLFKFLITLTEEEVGKFEINIQIEIYCYVAIYAFYIQNQLINSTKYQQLESNININLKNYINFKFKNYKLIKSILLLIFNIITEILIWSVFFVFFILCCHFEINLFYGIKLGLFFIVIYNFLRKTQIIEKNINISLSINSFLIGYCCFNSFIVYLYQLLCLDLVGFFNIIKESNNIIIENFPSIGLINYQNKDLIIKLFPHFLSNFLSILMYYELKSIYDRIDNENKEILISNDIYGENENKLNDIKLNTINDIIINKNLDKDDNLNNNIIINTNVNNSNKIINEVNTEENMEIKDNKVSDDENNVSENKENDKNENEDDINTKESNLNKENMEEINTDNIQTSNCKTKEEEKETFNINLEEEENNYNIKYIENQNEITSLNRKYIFYLTIIFIIKLYHPSVFLLIGYFFTFYNISLSLIIYFLIFGLVIIFMFTNILNNTSNYNYNYHHSYLMTQLIRYRSVETKKHKKICNSYKYQSFKFLSIFSFIFIFLNYIYSIFYFLQDCNNNKIDGNQCTNNTTIIENVSYGNYVKSTFYLFGIYNFSEKEKILDACGIYILIGIIICMDVYIQKLDYKIDNKKKTNRKKYYDLNQKKRRLKCIIYVIKNIKDKKENNNYNNLKILYELDKDYKSIENKHFEKMKIGNNFENDFIEIFKNSKKLKVLLPEKSTKRRIIIFMRNSKRLIEYLIILILICGVIIKVNIWSIIYMAIVIYLLLTKKNINKFNYLFRFIIISTFIQSIVFLSNINEKIDPNCDINTLKIINETLHIPWYEKTLGDNYIRHSVLLGLGINTFQLRLIWIEYSLIFLIYVYLYYFCYTIFNNRFMELKEWKKQEKKSLIYNFLFNSELREALTNIQKHAYLKILNCMNNNFDVKIPHLSEIKKSISKYNQSNKNKKQDIFSQRKEKIFRINLIEYIIYLNSHNIILITITVISMMTYGFLSAIYICFCLYFLFRSKSINLGKIYYYPFVIKSLLRPIIIIDISFQLLIQIPYIYSNELTKDGFFKSLSMGLGLIRIINEKYELTKDIFLLLGKCFCFFCMCIQKVIYSSRNFNEFYLSYLIIKNEKFIIGSLVNTFQFNNERINTMNKSIFLKKDMENSMKNLQKDLKEWNKNLFSQENNKIIDSNLVINENINNENNNNIDLNDNTNNIENKANKLNSEIDLLSTENNSNKNIITIDNFINTINENKIVDENIVRDIVKNWILKQTFLLRIHLYLNKKSFCYSLALDRKEGDKFIFNTIKGENEHIPLIQRKIDEEISKLNLSSFRNSEIKTLRKYLKRLNKINSYDFSKIIFFLKNEDESEKEKKKKLDEKFKELIKQEKYNQFSKIKNSKLFQKYLKKNYLFKKIILDIEIIISNNFNWVCYFVMIFHHICNASIISLFYPLSIFCYALLEYPRPSRKYWLICLIYTFTFLIINCFIQKQFIGAFINMNGQDSETYYSTLKTFFDHYPIGIKLFDNQNIKAYFIFLITEFMVIIALIINIHILIINGLWEKGEKYIENIYQGLKRVSINKDLILEDEKQIKEFNKNYLKEQLKTHKYLIRRTTLTKNEIKDYYKMISNSKNKLYEETKNYFQKLFPRIRNEKPGGDYYYIYSLIMMVLILYSLFFYTSMVRDKTYGAVNISTNQFSGMSIILVLIHIIILIYDRVIYLRQNRYNIKYDYIFFDKKRQKFIEGEDNEVKEKIINLYPESNKNNNFKIPFEYMTELNKDYNVIIFQNETFNMPLFEKYILYILLIILSHLFIFFYITMEGNYNINNAFYCIREQPTDECNDFLENSTTVIYYLLFLVYHIFSSLQIKYGFYDIKRKSIFKNINSIHGLLYNGYKLIPFYYPLKNIVDWTFTPTSLNLFDWFRFENLYDAIFKTYRKMFPVEKRPIGKRIKKIFKLLIGGIFSLILLLVLIIPLIMYSSLNPTNEINNITSAQMKIYLSFIDNNLQEKNYLIFENDWAEGINLMSNDVFNNFGYSKSFYTKTFPKDQIQVVSFYSEPENSLSDFKLSHIITSLDSLLNETYNSNQTLLDENVTKCNLVIETTFIRPLPNEAKTVTKKSEILICDSKELESEGCKGLNESYFFFNNSNEYHRFNEINIKVSGFSPFVRLTASPEPKQIELEKQINKQLILKPSYKNRAVLFEIYFENINNKKGVQYHIFNDKVSSSTSGYSILGFYSAFILVIGTYVTNFFNYNPEKLMISEMPHPEKLLNLCECIKISRYTYDFKKEEYLYCILIEIMRTPDFIKKLTQSTVEQFQRRTNLPS